MLPFEWLITYQPYQFISKLKEVACRLKIEPSWLMMVIWVECRLRSQAQNKYSNAFGLIQCLPSTLASLGYSLSHVKGKMGVWQLEYLVYPYLKPYAGKMNSAYDVYLAVFHPRALGRRDDFVIAYETEKAYKYNEILDSVFGDNDGKLEVLDVKCFFRQSVMKSLRTELRKTNTKAPKGYAINFY